MDGKVISVCTVTIAKKFEMVSSETGKEVARGRVVWSRKVRKNGELEKVPEFRKVIAFRGAARSLCYLDKGDPVQFVAEQQSQQNEVEKDGVKTVYNDVVFAVYGDVTFLPRGGGKSSNEENTEGKSLAAPAQPGKAQEPIHDYAKEDFASVEATEEITSALPF